MLALQTIFAARFLAKAQRSRKATRSELRKKRNLCRMKTVTNYHEVGPEPWWAAGQTLR